MIDEYKCYVARSDFNGNAGSNRAGTWTVRVPADRFQSFRKDVTALGQPLRDGTAAEDVTEEYVDLEADIKNLKEKENKLNELMKAKAQTLQDLVVWEKEIASVRGEIGRKEARKQMLTRLTAMSTVSNYLTRRERNSPTTTAARPAAATAAQLLDFANLSGINRSS